MRGPLLLSTLITVAMAGLPRTGYIAPSPALAWPTLSIPKSPRSLRYKPRPLASPMAAAGPYVLINLQIHPSTSGPLSAAWNPPGLVPEAWGKVVAD